MSYFTFDQNNSGGVFIENDNLTQYVIIEANTAREANAKFLELGGYFDGAGDCPCCGPRWYQLWEDVDGPDEPLIYDQPLNGDFYKDRDLKVYAIIHYLDGRKVTYFTDGSVK